MLGIVLDSGLDSGALGLVFDFGVFGLVLDSDAKQGFDSGIDSNKSVIGSRDPLLSPSIDPLFSSTSSFSTSLFLLSLSLLLVSWLLDETI